LARIEKIFTTFNFIITLSFMLNTFASENKWNDGILINEDVSFHFNTNNIYKIVKYSHLCTNHQSEYDDCTALLTLIVWREYYMKYY